MRPVRAYLLPVILTTACAQQLTSLCQAARDYATEHDGLLPPGDTWSDDIAPYLLNRAIALCRVTRYEEACRDILAALELAPDLLPIVAALDDLAPMKASGYLNDVRETLN
jgi:hypothetical protein